MRRIANAIYYIEKEEEVITGMHKVIKERIPCYIYYEPGLHCYAPVFQPSRFFKRKIEEIKKIISKFEEGEDIIDEDYEECFEDIENLEKEIRKLEG